MNKYSILIPIHNEASSIEVLMNSLTQYLSAGHEVIIVNDGSTDRTTQILEKYKSIKLINIKENKGKGYAIKKGLKKIRNNKVIIFDGDMEICPSEISKLMILDNDKDIDLVVGYRFKSLRPLKSYFDWGNFMFTNLFNFLFKSNLKDVLSCAKAFYVNDIRNVRIHSNGFDIDIELLSLLIQKKSSGTLNQVALNYTRRTFSEGKKLKISDGWIILSRLIKMTKYF